MSRKLICQNDVQGFAGLKTDHVVSTKSYKIPYIKGMFFSVQICFVYLFYS